MKIIILTKIKFLKYQEKVRNILINYGFKNITTNISIGELSTQELENIKMELEKNNKGTDSIIIVPICQGCYKNIYQIGVNINIEEQQYVIL